MLSIAVGFGAALASVNAAAAQGIYTVVAAPGASAPVIMSAPPNARCDLAMMGARQAHPLTAFSDARGAVRFFFTARREVRTGMLATLECRNAKAHTLVGVTLVPGAVAPRGQLVRPSHRSTIADLATTARQGVLPGTPAAFDVTTAGDEQLARFHYPRRPNPQINPTGYLIWRKLVTTPGAFVPSGAVPDPKVHGPVVHAQIRKTRRSLTNAATSFSVATSPNWSGVVINNQPSPFFYRCGDVECAGSQHRR